MWVPAALAIAAFAFGAFIFLRGQHTMHQVVALIFFLMSALFMREVRAFLSRRRPAPAAAAGADSSDGSRQNGESGS